MSQLCVWQIIMLFNSIIKGVILEGNYANFGNVSSECQKPRQKLKILYLFFYDFIKQSLQQIPFWEQKSFILPWKIDPVLWAKFEESLNHFPLSPVKFLAKVIVIMIKLYLIRAINLQKTFLLKTCQTL